MQNILKNQSLKTYLEFYYFSYFKIHNLIGKKVSYLVELIFLHFFDQNLTTVKLSGDDNLTAMRVLLCRIYVALNFRVGFTLKVCCLLYRSSELSQNTK